MTTSRRSQASTLAYAGVLMPIWLLGFGTILGALRPGYDPLRDGLSELGATGATDPLFWNLVGFTIAGTLELVYAFALRREFGAGWLFRGTAGLAIAIAASAAFPCDPGCPIVPQTPTMAIHTVLGLTAFLFLAILPLAGWRTFRNRADWRALAPWSMGVGCVLAILFVLGPILGPDRVGLMQRIYLPVAFAWQMAVAWRLVTDAPASRESAAVKH